MTDWRDMIVGARMAVDNEFSPNVENSQFSRQEWGLIMTATTLEIESPEDPENARIVADTSKLPEMMPEIEKVAEMGPMGMPDESSSGSGLLDSIRGALGLAGSNGASEREKIDAATQLVNSYAAQLQRYLEANGRWEEIREAAAEQS